MKRFVLSLLTFLLSAAMFAQTQSGEFLVFRNGGFYLGDAKVSESELATILDANTFSTTYRTGSSFRTAGIVLTSVGAVGVAGGIAGYAVSVSRLTEEQGSDGTNAAILTGSVLTGIVGACCLPAGIVFLCLGNNKMKRVAANYNIKDNSACLSLSSSENGFGLRLTF